MKRAVLLSLILGMFRCTTAAEAPGNVKKLLGPRAHAEWYLGTYESVAKVPEYGKWQELVGGTEAAQNRQFLWSQPGMQKFYVRAGIDSFRGCLLVTIEKTEAQIHSLAVHGEYDPTEAAFLLLGACAEVNPQVRTMVALVPRSTEVVFGVRKDAMPDAAFLKSIGFGGPTGRTKSLLAFTQTRVALHPTIRILCAQHAQALAALCAGLREVAGADKVQQPMAQDIVCEQAEKVIKAAELVAQADSEYRSKRERKS